MQKQIRSQGHLFGLGLALILLIVVAVFSYVSWHAYVFSADATKETRAVINALDRLLLQLQTAESSVRGFLLTRDGQELKNYTAAAAGAQREAQQISRWRKPYLNHPTLLARFQAAVLNRLAELQAIAVLETANEIDRAEALVKAQQQEATMQQVTSLAEQIFRHEDYSLSVTRDRSRSYARLSQLIATAGSCGIFIVVLLSALQIHRLVSTRNRLTQNLGQLAADFQHLADSVPQMVWRTSAGGSLEYVNRRWLDFSGQVGTGSPVSAWHALLHPDDRENFIKRWEQALLTHEPLAVECRLRDHATGRYRWFLFRATLVRDDTLVRDERPRRFRWFGTFTDIDRQKATETAIQRANEDLQQFIFSASHDLQEPLRTMMIYSQLLERRLKGTLDEAGRQDLGFILEGASRMRLLISDLLSYTEAASIDSEQRQESDAAAILQKALENLAANIQSSHAEIRYNGLPKVCIPESQLLQLWQNLVGNALKYHQRDVPPVIEIAAQQGSGEWIFSVKDNGIGIDPAYHKQIFGIFKRLHTSEQYSGTGLGLAICRKIVERRAGRIWVESRLGNGATFYFALPCLPGGGEMRG